MERLNILSERIIGAAIEVHRNLGPGLLESVYLECLNVELISSGLTTEREVVIPIKYKDKLLAQHMRMDLLVEREIIVETKSVTEFLPVHAAQLLTYLRLSKNSWDSCLIST